jgi:enterochelin esterase-like enzyme
VYKIILYEIQTKIKTLAIFIILAVFINISLISQPGFDRGLSLHSNIIYTSNENITLQLDLYTPGGADMAGGIGLVGKEPKDLTTQTSVTTSTAPVIIWLPVCGNDKFPAPVTGFVGNGYAVASMQYESNSEKVKNIGQAISYLISGADSFKLDIKNIGIIQQSVNEYIAAIWHKDMQNSASIADAECKLRITAPNDHDFSRLQSSENSSSIIFFFDKYLRNGIHTESDPLTLRCPPDSWVDPITNTIPGTSYHLFPTTSRGENTKGSYLIYLPEDYSSSNDRYPVIYWLHGGNGNSREGNWMCEQIDAAIERGDMPQTIVVFVQGLPIGWYNNSKDGTMPVEDVIINDLIPHIDATYRTISKREARGIEGMSMGGYGSLHLGFKYPELFGVVSSIAPSITTFEMERKEVITPTFEDDTAYFNANSPSTLLQRNADYIRVNTNIRLLVGDKDFLFKIIQEFHQQLMDLHINHQYGVAKDADHDYKEVIKNLDSNSFTFWKSSFILTE